MYMQHITKGRFVKNYFLWLLLVELVKIRSLKKETRVVEEKHMLYSPKQMLYLLQKLLHYDH